MTQLYILRVTTKTNTVVVTFIARATHAEIAAGFATDWSAQFTKDCNVYTDPITDAEAQHHIKTTDDYVDLSDWK